MCAYKIPARIRDDINVENVEQWMPHIRHLMAYKRFIEHIYTLGTFTNCCLRNRRRRWWWWRNERPKNEQRDCERERERKEMEENGRTLWTINRMRITKKNYWVKLKRKSLMRIFCLNARAREQSKRDAGIRNQKSKYGIAISYSWISWTWIVIIFYSNDLVI